MGNNIPKLIHYCWFGGNPLPESAVKCIESWKKFCPDYEIVEWNESNFDLNACNYVREAYEAKKWAFVSDYARFKILYENGGLYFDTDVELIKPIDDIVEKGAFMACENTTKNPINEDLLLAVAPGLGIGAPVQLPIYQEFLDFYHNKKFLNEDGTLDTTTVVYYISKILCKHGLEQKDAVQTVGDITVYPKEYFCPKDYRTGVFEFTGNTRAIHYYDSSWLSDEDKYAHLLRQKHIPNKIAKFIAAWKFQGLRGAIKKVIDKCKN